MSVQSIVAHATGETKYTSDAITAWHREVNKIYEEAAKPITSMDDPRAALMLERGVHPTTKEPYDPEFLKEHIEFSPEFVGERFFTEFRRKPEPPIPAPAWAEETKFYWGMFPVEVEVWFSSKPMQVGSCVITWQQMFSIDTSEDGSDELLEVPVVHVSPVEFHMSDGSSSLTFPADVDEVFRLSAAIDDAARHMWRATEGEAS